MDLPNRVLLPAMDMNLCADGMITAAEVAHYSARAGGGAALVITGSGAVAFPIGATSRHQPGLSSDDFIPGLKLLADAVHSAGGKVCMQLCHHGKVAGVDIAEGRPLLVPSVPVPGFALDALVDNPMPELLRLATASQGKPPTYRAATDEDLAWVIDQFVAAATRAQVAGCDAVEIHAAHGYLLSTFLSRAYNHRLDQWGGSPENRARLTTEVVRAVRARVGATFPILVRINGEEFGIADGIDAPEAEILAVLIEAAGADAIHVTANAHNPFADFTDGPLPNTVGRYRELARAVKRAVTIPVIAVGRVLPELAEEMISVGDCDFVALGRQQLADPELVNKLANGQRSKIRPCINCYVCVEQNFFDAPPRCAVNPALGNETRLKAVGIRSRSVRSVLVIGGGPAGMELARIAAEMGHRVTLLESTNRLGGTAWFSQLTTPANQPLVEWLQREMVSLGIEVHLAKEATVQVVRDLAPDVVVVATGARPGLPDVPGVHLPIVHSGDDLRTLLAGTDQRHSKVVVVGGGLVGLELAHFLAERGRQVTVLESGPHIGLPMAMPRRWAAVRSAVQHGVILHRNAVLQAIEPKLVRFCIGDEQHTLPTDYVLLATGVAADHSFADALVEAGFEVHTIGDAAAVGYIEGAIHSAWALAEVL